MGSVRVWARAGSEEDGISWDPWRERWVVSCRAPARSGEANEAIAGLLARWLGLAAFEVHWASAGRSRAKRLEVPGLSDEVLALRLQRAADRSIRAGPRDRPSSPAQK